MKKLKARIRYSEGFSSTYGDYFTLELLTSDGWEISQVYQVYEKKQGYMTYTDIFYALRDLQKAGWEIEFNF